MTKVYPISKATYDALKPDMPDLELKDRVIEKVDVADNGNSTYSLLIVVKPK